MVQNDNNNILDDMARLKWACRRGMLELDVLLGNFLHERYKDLSPADKKRFVELLSCPDPDLFAWLMGKADPEDPSLLSIVELIRQHARSRF
jgi:antitoxin CptB